MGERPKQQVVDGDQKFTRLYEEGHASAPFLDKAGAALADTMRKQAPDLLGDAVFSQGPLKAKDRAAAKLAGSTSPDLDINKTAGITDIVRGRIIIDTPEQIVAIRNMLNDPDTLERLGIRHVKDRFAKPSDTHYRDINLTVELDNGHLAEIQINQRDMLAASEFTHDAYEDADAIQKRAVFSGLDLSPDDITKIDKLNNYAQDVHNHGAARVPGIDDLLSDAGRAKLEADYAARRAVDPDFKPGVTIEADTKYGVPHIFRAEAYGNEGYKALAKEHGVKPDRLNIDTSSIPDGTITWDSKTRTLTATDPDILADMLKRQGVTLQDYADMGANVRIAVGEISQPAADVFKALGKHSGLIGGIVLGGVAGVFTFAATGSTAQAAEVTYETAMPYGETQIDLARRDVEAAERSAIVETASNIGTVSGAFAGAAAGAAFGSVFPGVGTGIGAFVGGIMGGVGIGFGAGMATEVVYDNFKEAERAKPNIHKAAAEELHTRTCTSAVIMGHNDNLNPDAFFTRERLSNIDIHDNIPPELHALVEAETLLTQAEQTGKVQSIERAQDVFETAKEQLFQSPHVRESMHYAQCHGEIPSATKPEPDLQSIPQPTLKLAGAAIS